MTQQFDGAAFPAIMEALVHLASVVAGAQQPSPVEREMKITSGGQPVTSNAESAMGWSQWHVGESGRRVHLVTDASGNEKPRLSIIWERERFAVPAAAAVLFKRPTPVVPCSCRAKGEMPCCTVAGRRCGACGCCT